MNSSRFVDFHMHSNISDGTYKPEKLISLAAEAGLAAAGITDHDTIEGLDEASAAAQTNNIELIPGVEITALSDGEEIHILGYYPERINKLLALLKMLREERFTRMVTMVEKLTALGFKIKPEDVFSEAGEAAPGRLHLARVMLKKKYAHTINEAFFLYLNKNRPAYIQRKTIKSEDAIATLLEAKAVPIIAHPGKSGIKNLEKFIETGIKGIEVFHPDHDITTVKYCRKFAEKNDLLITGGSDFHGGTDKDLKYSGRIKVPYHHLEKMKMARGVNF